MNDYEAHLSSYDHSHKQRLKDMKAMVRDPNAGARARKAEAKADGLVSIKVAGNESGTGGGGGGLGGGGFKKGGFKKSGFKSAFGTTSTTAQNSSTENRVPAPENDDDESFPQRRDIGGGEGKGMGEDHGAIDSDSDGERWGRYDPRYPTD